MLPRGLERVTLTPGSTAPDGSEAVPPMAPTPCAVAGSVEHSQNDKTTMVLPTKSLAIIVTPLFDTARRVPCDCSDDREHTPGIVGERNSRQKKLGRRRHVPRAIGDGYSTIACITAFSKSRLS